MMRFIVVICVVGVFIWWWISDYKGERQVIRK